MIKKIIMNEFLLIFRRDYTTKELQPTAEKLLTHLKHWEDWFASLTDKDILARPVKKLDAEGVLLGNNTATDGPYRKMNESIGGFIIIKATDYDAAVKIAEGCPVLELGGSVEVRLGN
jgi:hypothetical protein